MQKGDFIRFVDKRFNIKDNGALYKGNLQIETITQSAFGNELISYKFIFNYLGVPKYYRE